MRQLRLFADQDGESHLEEMVADFSLLATVPPAPVVEVSEWVDVAGYQMLRLLNRDIGAHPLSNFLLPNREAVFIPSASRQLHVILSGLIEFEVSDGEKVRLTAGDVLRLEDTTGKGHAYRVIGGNEVLVLIIDLN